MNQLEGMLRIVKIDLSYFFRTKWLILTLVTLNLSDMFVVGLVYSNLVSFNYFIFFVPGVIIAAMFNAALDVGRRVHLGLSEGVSQYYLSLPISINLLALAHIISAGLGGLLFSSTLLIVAMAFIPKLFSISAMIILPFMLLISMSLGGIAAIINLFSGGGDRFWAFAEGVQTALLGLSTVFYPIQAVSQVIPKYFISIFIYNPISQIADSLRFIVYSGSVPSDFLARMFISSFIMTVIGFLCYRHIFEKLRILGKL